MKRKDNILILWIILLILLIPKCINAEQFQDSFTQPDGPAKNWEPNHRWGVWQIESKEYSGCSAADEPCYTFTGDKRWTDYTFQVRCKLIEGVSPERIGIVFRATDPNNLYRFRFLGGTYQWLDLYVRKEGQWTQLGATKPYTINFNTWYTFKVEIQDEGSGVRIKCYVNDVEQINYLEAPRTFSSGRIGLYNWQSHTHFDDVIVISPGGSPLFEDTFTEPDGPAGNWEPVEPIVKWEIEEQEYSGFASANQEGYTFAGNTSWTNYSYEARCKLIEGVSPERIGIVFRATDRYNLYRFRFLGGSYQQLDLYVRRNGAWTYLGRKQPYNLNFNEWYTFRVEVQDEGAGVRIKCYVNNVEQINVLENPKTFSSGRIGLYTYQSHNHFDDVKVTSIPTGTILFEDTFTEPNGPAINWEFEGIQPIWWVESQEYSAYTSKWESAFSFAGRTTWSDYSYQARCKLIEGTSPERLGICFRATDQYNLYLLYYIGGSYKRLYLYRIEDGSWSNLRNVSYTLTPDVWYTFKVEVQDEGSGVRIKCYVNDVERINYLESPRTFSSGRIGLYNYQCHSHFDDVIVTLFKPVINSLTVTPDPTGVQPVGGLEFKIVFSESMDTGVEPTVTYDPQGPTGPQPCTGGSWSTTTNTNDTYIVYNNNPIISTTGDGVATILVSGAQNLAAVVMDDDTTYFFNIDAANNPPNPPTTGFFPSQGTTSTTQTPTIRWNYASDPDPADIPDTLHYVLRLDDDGEVITNYDYEYTTLDGVCISTITNTLANKTYWYYAIKTVDDELAESSWSTIQNFYINAPPTVSSIIPNTGVNTGTLSTTITGTNFQSGATATLTRAGQPDIIGTTTFISSGTLTAIFDLTGAQPGVWSVVVINPDGQSGTLTDGFTIIDANIIVTKDMIINHTWDSGTNTVPGATIIYIITYTNNGNDTAGSVTITDKLMNYASYATNSLRIGTSGSTYESATPKTDAKDIESGGSADWNVSSSQAVTFELGSIPVGASGRLYFKIRVD
ncbi:MAG: hypothetical protein AB1422_04885 [bacterium]